MQVQRFPKGCQATTFSSLQKEGPTGLSEWEHLGWRQEQATPGVLPICHWTGSEGRCNNTALTVWYTDAGLSPVWSCSLVSEEEEQLLQNSAFTWFPNTTHQQVFLCQTDLVSWWPRRSILWLIRKQLSHLYWWSRHRASWNILTQPNRLGWFVHLGSRHNKQLKILGAEKWKQRMWSLCGSLTSGICVVSTIINYPKRNWVLGGETWFSAAGFQWVNCQAQSRRVTLVMFLF